MLKAKYVLIYGSLALTFVHCISPADIILPDQESKIAVVSHFRPDSFFTASVSVSNEINDTLSDTFLDNALVTLWENNIPIDTMMLVDDPNHDFPFWRGKIAPVLGIDYQLKVESPGLPAVNATGHLPAHISEPVLFYSEEDLNPIPLSSAYNLFDVTTTIHLPDFPDDMKFYGLYIYLITGRLEWTDTIASIKSRDLVVPTVYTSSLSADFVIYATDNSILIRDDYWDNNRDIDFRMSYFYNKNNERPLNLYYEWRTLSEDYYLYNYSVGLQKIKDPFAEPVSIYNNIVDGYGNFAGYNTQTDSLFLKNEPVRIQNEELLLAQIKKSDASALKIIFDAHYAFLLQTAANFLKDRDTNKDIVQDVFFELWKKREVLEIHSSLKAYLRQAVVNKSLTFIKNRKRFQWEEDNQFADVDSRDVTTQQILEASDTQDIINRAIDELPEKCRIVFVMSRLENMTHKEIAETLDISTKTIENQITKALKSLRIKLNKFEHRIS